VHGQGGASTLRTIGRGVRCPNSRRCCGGRPASASLKRNVNTRPIWTTTSHYSIARPIRRDDGRRCGERRFGLACQPITWRGPDDVPSMRNRAAWLLRQLSQACDLERAQHDPSSIHDTVSFSPCHCASPSPPSFPNHPSNCGSHISPIRPPTWTSQTSCECALGS
jgi:hypothetical protein